MPCSIGNGMMEVRRGDIFLVNLEPVLGAEQGRIRPGLVIQSNLLNKNSPTTIIVPITSKIYTKEYPTNLRIEPSGESGLKLNSTIIFNQIRTIDKSRIIKKIGDLPFELMQKVDSAITISLGLN